MPQGKHQLHKREMEWNVDALFQGIHSFSPHTNFRFWPEWFYRLQWIPMWPYGLVGGWYDTALSFLKCYMFVFSLTYNRRRGISPGWLFLGKKREKKLERDTMTDTLTGKERKSSVVFSIRLVYCAYVCLWGRLGGWEAGKAEQSDQSDRNHHGKLGFHKQE